MRQGELLEKWIDKKGISVIEFAEMVGKTRQTVYQYFETVKFSRKTLEKFLVILDLEFGEFVDTTLLTNIDTSQGVPYYPIEVDATNAPAMDDIRALTPEYYINIPFFREGDLAVRVRGDSMYPKYRHGDVIVCKRIMNKEWILLGEVYLIITKSDNYRTVKYLQQDPENDSNYMLVPYNNDVHKNQPIPKTEILELYLVLGSIREY